MSREFFIFFGMLLIQLGVGCFYLAYVYFPWRQMMREQTKNSEIKQLVEEAVRLVHRFDDGDLSYQALDNELHNLYAQNEERSGLRVEFPEKKEHMEGCLINTPQYYYCDCGVDDWNACIDEMKKLNSSLAPQGLGLDENAIFNDVKEIVERYDTQEIFDVNLMSSEIKDYIKQLSPQCLKPFDEKELTKLVLTQTPLESGIGLYSGLGIQNLEARRIKRAELLSKLICAKFAVPNEGLNK